MKTKNCSEMEPCNCMGNPKEEPNTGSSGNEILGKCMKKAKWFMLIPGFILISIFMITYFLPAEVVQVIWLVITGTLLGFGVLVFLMVGPLFRKSWKK